MSFEADMDMEEERAGRFSLERVLSAVRQRVVLVAAVAIASPAWRPQACFMMPNRFDASAVVQIDPRQKSISNLEGVVSSLAPTSSVVDSEVEVVRSTAIALKVIDALGLRSDPEFGGTAAAALGKDAPPAPATMPSAASSAAAPPASSTLRER